MRDRTILACLLGGSAALLTVAAVWPSAHEPAGTITVVTLQTDRSYTLDFGEIWVDQLPEPIRYQCRLRNDSDRRVRITDVTSSCGCLSATVDQYLVFPNHETTLSVELTVDLVGLQVVNVWLHLDNRETVTFEFSATGRRNNEIRMPSEWVRIDALPKGELVFFYTCYDSDSQPPVPEIASPAADAVGFQGWTQLHPSLKSTRQPARWVGRLIIDPSAIQLPAPIKIKVAEVEARLTVLGPD